MANHAETCWNRKPAPEAVGLFLRHRAEQFGIELAEEWDRPGDEQAWGKRGWIFDAYGEEFLFWINGKNQLETRHTAGGQPAWWLKGQLHSEANAAFGGLALYDDGCGKYLDSAFSQTYDAPHWREHLLRRTAPSMRKLYEEMFAAPYGSFPAAAIEKLGLSQKADAPYRPLLGFGAFLEKNKQKIGKKEAESLLRAWFILPSDEPPPEFLIALAGNSKLRSISAMAALAIDPKSAGQLIETLGIAPCDKDIAAVQSIADRALKLEENPERAARFQELVASNLAFLQKAQLASASQAPQDHRRAKACSI